MYWLLSKNKQSRRWRRMGGVLSGLLLAVLVLAGCTTQTKHQWLTFFFDGVPPIGATNRVAVVASGLTGTNGMAESAVPASAPARVIKLDVHPPYANRNCTACHESDYFAEDARQARRHLFYLPHGTANEFPAGKVKHQPVEDGDCMSCHNPHQSPNPKLLLKTGPALCLTCHDDPLAAGKVKHQAVEDGRASIAMRRTPPISRGC